ncbi:hypothetical protein [Corynebacterium flavescens]|uniref:Lipoprotein n=1 Tax=Corynebacterium flavescens TaxID=28028 RepID=A0A1L7CNH4_CORFL|nr:hypothetical protein [Corynebacterium flavescens]APT87402.1 hypothetical protein CFLV_09595 [Corynebacterium flavescens]KAA8720492.1 hypothetical protein F4V60_09340 [Corynebacterium flavescens]GEB97744.1 hypothetical protein CFL01nite_12390 [Corynebacterium flavescens]
MKSLKIITMLGAVSLLAACGGTSESQEATTTTSTARTTTSAAKPEKVDPATWETTIQALRYLQSQVTCDDTGIIDQGLTCKDGTTIYVVGVDDTGVTPSAMAHAAGEVDNSATIYGDSWFISCAGPTAVTACMSAGVDLTGYEQAGF